MPAFRVLPASQVPPPPVGGKWAAVVTKAFTLTQAEALQVEPEAGEHAGKIRAAISARLSARGLKCQVNDGVLWIFHDPKKKPAAPAAASPPAEAPRPLDHSPHAAGSAAAR